LRDTSERDAKAARCPKHEFAPLPEAKLPQKLWRWRCRVCHAVYSGREFVVLMEGRRTQIVETEAAMQRLSAEAEQPHPSGGWGAP
jgi:RecB family endonuclease NucS